MNADPSNAAIADALEQLGDLYELDGAVVHRVLAYRNAARSVRECTRSVAALTRAGTVTELPGIGATLQEKITALLDTGSIPAAERLRSRFPPGLIAITRLPGLGPKRARLLHEALGIDSLDSLRAAAVAQRVRGVPGLGPRFEESILAALERPVEDGDSRMLLPQALEITESLAEAIRAHGPADVLVQAAGSARRGADTVKDIDLVAITADPVGLSAAIAGLAPIASVVSAGPVGAKAVTHSGANVDLRIGSPEQHGNLLQHFTGSARHNAALRERAVRMGMHVSEYAISTDATGGRHHYATEEAVYAAMGLAFIAPELREDRGEIHAATGGAGGLPTLVERSDIRADALGYEYLAITDHSASHGFGNAVSADQLRRQIERIREIDDALTGITVLAGSEVNVATDGSLDYPDQLLGELDWVIASVHTAFSMSAEAMTARMVAAIEHPLVDAIGHPTGRLLGRRAPYDLDLETVFAAAAKTATMLEINANPRRRDLSDSAAAAAARAGVTLVINSDAHGTDTLGNMRWGVLTARRAWLRASDVANTRPWAELRSMRGRAGAATGREAARP